MAQVLTKPIDPYRATERTIMIVIISIILIHVSIPIVLITIQRITSVLVDEVRPNHAHSRSHEMCRHWLFQPPRGLNSTQT